ncbi:Ribosomal lysine N-methyltransferase set11 [Golovinomyces cichoracearum]|uniref:Ribosomal lysine N-methyltransferase set11 n=1 Tax=Golovinomyces cichoracearum TaxID=62708 RepID=A0A420IYP3_9PEZI|nr:Ribosomal lysine N-methyltransferase set11 [Golovinomyces cichoracearum]
MDIHEEFTQWTIRRGLKIHDIKLHRFPGRGIGIAAKKRIKADSVLLHVPHSALRTQYTVSRPVVEATKEKRISVHGLLATDHALENSLTVFQDDYKPWHSILPSYSEFQESISICWPVALQKLLPPMAKIILSKQRKKIQTDWSIASNAFPCLTFEKFLYSWLLINTRTFYFVPPSSCGVHRPFPKRDDCMALNPFSDCFNHNPCPSASVKVTESAFTITSTRDIDLGEEVTISYGNHSNDFLLAEYGFVVDENPWDEVLLDDYILPLLDTAQKTELESVGFLGNYLLDRNSVCHRTEVVIRILCLPLQRWRRFVHGLDDGDNDQPQVDRTLLNILTELKRDVQQTLRDISSFSDNFSIQKKILDTRWRQIDKLSGKALNKCQAQD